MCVLTQPRRRPHSTGFFLSAPKETNRRCSLTSSIKVAPRRLNGERIEAGGQGEG